MTFLGLIMASFSFNRSSSLPSIANASLYPKHGPGEESFLETSCTSSNIYLLFSLLLKTGGGHKTQVQVQLLPKQSDPHHHRRSGWLPPPQGCSATTSLSRVNLFLQLFSRPVYQLGLRAAVTNKPLNLRGHHHGNVVPTPQHPC